MANWNGLILTDAGRNLQAKVEAGKTKLSLTKFKLGNGAISGQQTLEGLTDLISPKQIIGINTCTPKENGLCTITGTIVNTGLIKGYELKELGVFATDPDSGEILYAVTTDTHPDYLQPEGGATVVSAEFSLNIAISNTDKVTAVIDVNGLASIGNVHLLIAEHNRAADAHGNIITAHNSNVVAHADIRTKITNDIATHNSNAAAHGNIITAHNSNAAAHADLLKLFAKLASPALTGTPTAPTAAAATNNTQIATTAFVQAAATAANCGGIVGGSLAQNGWVKFANGLILQWGSRNSDVDGIARLYFPITFTAFYTIVGIHMGGDIAIVSELAQYHGLSNTALWIKQANGAVNAFGLNWIAVGR